MQGHNRFIIKEGWAQYTYHHKNHNKQCMNRKKKNQSLVKITILKHQKCLVMPVPEQKTTSKNHTFIH